jgi:hypothetical protein
MLELHIISAFQLTDLAQIQTQIDLKERDKN